MLTALAHAYENVNLHTAQIQQKRVPATLFFANYSKYIDSIYLLVCHTLRQSLVRTTRLTRLALGFPMRRE